jgi:protein-S-isoprenylcysteine O-methyltransferase Ste14
MPRVDRLPELGPRGEGWLVLQLLLGAAIIGCGFVGVYWPGSADSFLDILGLLIAVAAVLLVLLFDLKARREEAWLIERFPAYATYREGTPRRFVPWLY